MDLSKARQKFYGQFMMAFGPILFGRRGTIRTHYQMMQIFMILDNEIFFDL